MAALTSLNIFKTAPASQDDEFSLLPFEHYDRVCLQFSAGKDSVASALRLLELGVPASKIELHHHLVDGDSDNFMDWPVTRAYCKAFADAMGMRYTESWREGGFRKEMLKHESRSLPVTFIDDSGNRKQVGGLNGKIATRRMFPQVSGSLTDRWCSSSLKVDVGNAFLRHTPRFQVGKTLVVTGERAQESAGRAKYPEALIHSTGCSRKYKAVVEDGTIVKKPDGVKRMNKRWIDHYRPVHSWKEEEVWAIIRRHGIVPHPAYYLGFSRCSCKSCIFLGENSLATLRKVDPEGFDELEDYEAEFGVTIDRKRRTVAQRADKGRAYDFDVSMGKLAMSHTYDAPIKVESSDWILPIGAYGENDGPT